MNKDKSRFLLSLKNIPIKKLLIVLGIIIAIVVVIFVYLQDKKITLRDIITVDVKDVQKTVLASGKVVSATDLALSFQASDIVRSINVSVGDKVKTGQVIATLANAEEQADLTRAQGNLLGAQARYRKLLEGAGSADIIAAEDAFKNAERTQNRLVDNARRTLFSDDLKLEAQRTDMISQNTPIISGIYLGDEETSYNLFFEQSNQTLSYSGAEKGKISVLSLQQPFGTRGLSITFPVTSYPLNEEWVVKIPNKVGKNYTINLNAYNSAVATREEVLGAAQSKIDLLKTKARRVDLDAAEADVLVAKSGVASALAVLEKKIVRAPAEGTITKIDIKLGDSVIANTPVITLQDISNLYVESNVNEADIVGVTVGQPVEITFEAFGKHKIFNGELYLVNIGATTNESVVNYKVRALLKDPGEVRSGMTADLKIITARVDNAIAIPSRYIGEENNKHYVNVVLDENKRIVRKQFVEEGETGDGSIVVIKEGLHLNDKIAIVDEIN